MKKILALTVAALLAGNALAAQDHTVKLPIEGTGEVKHNDTLAVSLSPLDKDVFYQITCLINNPYTQNIPMKFTYKFSGSFITAEPFNLNGKSLIESHNQGDVLPKNDNILIAKAHVEDFTNSVILLKNLDNDEPVFVHDCTAVPVVSPSVKK